MQRDTLGALVAVLVVGCGSGDTTNVDDGGGGKDATKDTSFVFPSDGGDADVEIDSGPPCAPGDYYLTITNDAGSTKLTTGCGDAAVPYITAVDPCRDCFGLRVSACGAGESFQMDTTGLPGNSAVFTSSASATLIDADGGMSNFGGPMTTYWPSNGGTVKGDYTGVGFGGQGISAHFCLKQQ